MLLLWLSRTFGLIVVSYGLVRREMIPRSTHVIGNRMIFGAHSLLGSRVTTSTATVAVLCSESADP